MSKSIGNLKFIEHDMLEINHSDKKLFSQFKKSIPKSKIYSSIRKKSIKVNGKRTKADYKIKLGDKITYPNFVIKHSVSNSANLDQHKELIKSAIIYESDRFIVINKPPNYAVHGGSGLNFGIIEIIRMLYTNKWETVL